ncbi:hypothetical protein Tco_0416181, partial [Tanacetum coccineum]
SNESLYKELPFREINHQHRAHGSLRITIVRNSAWEGHWRLFEEKLSSGEFEQYFFVRRVKITTEG